jgi:hypothetical protein
MAGTCKRDWTGRKVRELVRMPGTRPNGCNSIKAEDRYGTNRKQR